jgi:tetratricopeptide (TPR) repeat protein
VLRSWVPLTVCLALVSVTTAHAEPDEARSAAERAREEYELGRDAFDHQRYDEAVAHYLEAYRLAPRPALLFNIALAYERANEPARALEHYRLYVRLEPDGDGAVEARARIEALERTLKESEKPAPEQTQSRSRSAITAASPRVRRAAPRRASPSFLKSPLLWSGVGLVFGVTGAYFGWQTRKDQDRLDGLNSASADHDFADADGVIDRGRRHALLANLSFAAAAVASGVGVYFFIARDRQEPAAAAGGSGMGAGLTWTGHF